MTTNPLARRRAEPANDFGIQVVRTGRAYVFDLCDAYNLARTRPDEVEWYVTPKGELKLGYRDDWSRRHTRAMEAETEAERDRFKRRTAHG